MENKVRFGFLRWFFRDSHKSLSFWGFVTVILAIVMLYSGCPAPWPLYTLIVGIVMTFVDVAIIWYSFSHAVYEMEQAQIMRDHKKD
jgi:hypothetical protein